MKIAPSILACDLANLEMEAKSVDNAEYLHIDVMDGMFVPNISFGLPVVASLRKKNSSFFDVHLMIEKPERYVVAFAEAGADLITFHAESTSNIGECVRLVRACGKKVGISIKPGTPVQDILDFLPDVDLVLVMTVEPGFGGQKLIKNCLEKVDQLRDMKKFTVYNYIIEADGGIGEDNYSELAGRGVELAVMGSAVFGLPAKDRNGKIAEYEKMTDQGEKNGYFYF